MHECDDATWGAAPPTPPASQVVLPVSAFDTVDSDE